MEFKIVADNSGHEYVIPVNKSEDWYKFMEIPEDNPDSWNVPNYAERIDGGSVIFKEYRIG